MRTYLKSTLPLAQSNRYMVVSQIPKRLGWIGTSPKTSAGFIFAVDHPDDVSPEEVGRLAASKQIEFPGRPEEEADQSNWVYELSDITGGDAWRRFSLQREAKRRAGAPKGNKNAAKEKKLDGRVDLRLPRDMVNAMRAATYQTGDQGLRAFCQRLIEQELDRLGLNGK